MKWPDSLNFKTLALKRVSSYYQQFLDQVGYSFSKFSVTVSIQKLTFEG